MIETVFIGIVVFLCVLAVFDLVVGVSNDAVNFINSAIGAKAASFKVIITIAAAGVFIGAAVSNGMMDVARHGIFTPEYYTFYEVMCIFLAVMVTDVVLLDVFNTLGMPTSTTVSMVFEILGGACALALMKMLDGATADDGTLLGIGDLLNTDKALSVILAIFLSVAVAFFFGTLVMWISRLSFTFVNPQKSKVKTVIFGAVSATAIVWFLLINGLKASSFMTAEVKEYINENTWTILGGCLLAMVLLMSLLQLVKVNILRVVVLMGTFALAMAFAGNDLVNFVGVPLTGLDAYLDFQTNGNGDPNTFMMESLQGSAQTPAVYLLLAGGVMVCSLVFSKKAQNVVKTSVDLSRQDEGDEMFGSSALARALVRNVTYAASVIGKFVPARLSNYVDRRFDRSKMNLEDGAAFDMVRASVNLVLAGLLVALGTTFKLPLSTTYVTFMVAMGASLADRAWSRESAVFRITGVMSVIGGWFVTAAVAFIFCFIVTSAMFYGSYVAMGVAIVVAVFLLVRSNIIYSKKKESAADSIFAKIMNTHDRREIWKLLCEHIRKGNVDRLKFVVLAYRNATDSFVNETYRPLKKGSSLIDDERIALKRQRRREIVSMRRLDPLTIIQRNTWYFLGISSCQQMLYCLKRINDPIREHVGNHFTPLPEGEKERFITMREIVVNMYERTIKMIESGDFSEAEAIRNESTNIQSQLSADRKLVLDSLTPLGSDVSSQKESMNTLLLTVHILQESQELVGCLRHMIRGMVKFDEQEPDLDQEV